MDEKLHMTNITGYIRPSYVPHLPGKESRKQVVPIQVDYDCPKCAAGQMRPTGCGTTVGWSTYWPHECNNSECDYKETFEKQYPFVVYEEIK